MHECPACYRMSHSIKKKHFNVDVGDDDDDDGDDDDDDY